MTREEIAQWVIDNRFPKSEDNKVSDLEMYHKLVDEINRLKAEQVDPKYKWVCSRLPSPLLESYLADYNKFKKEKES